MPRTAIREFELANPLYANCRVSFYTVAGGIKTATLAPLWAAASAGSSLPNPQSLDSNGKFRQAVYADVPVIGVITGQSVPSHSTGIINPAPIFRVDQATSKLQYSFDAGQNWNDSGQTIFKDRGAWLTATSYNLLDLVMQSGLLYVAVVAHTSGVFATDLAAAKWRAVLTLTASAIANVPAGNIAATDVQAALNELDAEKVKKAGDTMTGALLMSGAAINEAAQVDVASAATCAIGAALSNNVRITGTTPITGFDNVAAGIVRRGVFQGVVPLTNSATFDIPGATNYTTAAGDRFEAVSLGGASWRFNWITKADGTPLLSGSTKAPVRQTVLASAVDANGYANFLSAGAALNYNVAATTTPLEIAFAAGFDSSGASDLIARLTQDQANQGALAASNTSYSHATYVGASLVTWSNCLVPPQYGYAFDRTKQSLLNFEGINGAATTTDDFGNTWTANGNAQISTAQFRYGASSSLLDGTGDFWSNTTITTLGDGSWEISTWVRTVSLAAVQTVFNAAQAASLFGVVLQITVAGKLDLYLSSNGTSHDIVSGTAAGATLAINTWYKVRLVFDALAGTYRVYLSNNGAAETQDFTLSSSARICSFAKFRIGADGAGANGFNGWVDAFRFVSAATNTTTETPSVSAPAIGDLPVHFFSIPEWKMYEVTAASVTAGVNPTLTARNRVFTGEHDTNATNVTAIRTYALRGEFLDVWTTPYPGVATAVSRNHKLGVTPLAFDIEIECVTADGGYVVGERLQIPFGVDATTGFPVPITRARNTVGFTTGAVNSAQQVNKTTGARFSLTLASWKYRVNASRGWR